MDETGRLIGLFSGCDAVNRVLADALDPAITLLRDVMTPRPDTLTPQARAPGPRYRGPAADAGGGFRHVPVTEGPRPVGIVSFADFNRLERTRLDKETGFWEFV